MERVQNACNSGKYELYSPFKDISSELIPMLTKRLREIGYDVEFNVGEDGPNRPGHDELRWLR
jgi:hypothetical protein